jgi:hypothetical protein
MADIYQRPAEAARMAEELLHPGPLDEGLRSGLFLSGLRRTGKTTFLRNDLIPALEARGALVLYVDLWADTRANPSQLVLEVVRQALNDAQTAGSALLARLARLRGLELSAPGLKFGFKVDSVGTPGGTTLAQALTELVDQAGTDVVLIVDEVQHAITSDDGHQLLLALKAARDAINPRPGTHGHFLFIGTGSHRAQVGELTARRNQAFAGATSVDYPVLGVDYVQHLLARLAGQLPLPTLEVAVGAFGTLGHRPEELLRALRQLRTSLAAQPADSALARPDALLPVIAQTLRSAAADVELHKVEQLGGLGLAIFDRIAQVDGDARGLFSADAAADYGRQIGREVRTEEIQPMVNELLAANVVMRRGHGLYCIADPLVQQLWNERKLLMAPLPPA